MAMVIQINFKNDLSNTLQFAAQKFGYLVKKSSDLNNLVYAWLEFNSRTIAPKPRKVFLSKEIQQSPLASKMSLLIKECESGVDLNGYLSINSLLLKKPDLLLTDWDIKHFHFDNHKISTAVRSKELVFFRHTLNEIYFIQIGNHNFSDLELLEIINRNWPNQISKLNGIKGEKYTSEQIHNFRRRGIIVTPGLNDGTAVYGMGGGYTGAKTSIKLQMQADFILRSVEAFEAQCRKIILNGFLKKGDSNCLVKGKLRVLENGKLIFKATSHPKIQIITIDRVF